MRRTLLQNVPSLVQQTPRASARVPFVCRQCLQQSLQTRMARRPVSASASLNSPAEHNMRDLQKKLEEAKANLQETLETNPDRGPVSNSESKELAAAKDSAEPEDFEGFEDIDNHNSDHGYEPAKTWDGLERIGGPSGWWEEAWDQENQFQGFLPTSRIPDTAITSAVRRATIEVLALQEAGWSLEKAGNALEYTTFDYGQVGLESENGKPMLIFENEGVRAELLESMAEDHSTSDIDQATANKAPLLDEESSASTEAQGYSSIDEADPGWFNISIEDLKLRFAVLKRVMQLTGVRVPDHEIRKITTMGGLVRQVLTKPKPTKLADILLSKPELTALPNVEIFEYRRTPIDKEKEVGRWKVIEKELVRRGLPVTGHY